MNARVEFEHDRYLRVIAMNPARAREFTGRTDKPVYLGQADPQRYKFGARVYISRCAGLQLQGLQAVSAAEKTWIVVGLTEDGDELRRITVRASKLDTAVEMFSRFADWVQVVDPDCKQKPRTAWERA